ncbi:DUF6318 family protein [Kineococcus sp. SYSU DK006]|uniref:DUF6318 family protein n=1 Tax=Kineococcus sp. SYSU DK006 TaxID=3383127 RepID=UPI003D7E9F59
MIPLRPAAVPVAALTALGLLTGCSGPAPSTPAPAPAATGAAAAAPAGPAPQAPPTPSAPVQTPAASTPTPLATRSLPAPELDPLGRVRTEEGASYFAVHFVAVLNHARETGDPSLLRQISDPGCTGCAYYAEEIDEYRKRGYSNVGLELVFRGTDYDYWHPQSGELGLTVITDRSAHSVVDAVGTVIDEVPELLDGRTALDLKWLQNRWVVWEVE